MSEESGSMFPFRKVDESEEETGSRIRQELSDAAEAPALTLSSHEAVIASNALNEVLNGPNAIDDAEFQTRMGASRDEAVAALEKLGRR